MVEVQISPIGAICTVQISEDEYEKRVTREDPSHRRDQRTGTICRVAETNRGKTIGGPGSCGVVRAARDQQERVLLPFEASTGASVSKDRGFARIRAGREY